MPWKLLEFIYNLLLLLLWPPEEAPAQCRLGELVLVPQSYVSSGRFLIIPTPHSRYLPACYYLLSVNTMYLLKLGRWSLRFNKRLLFVLFYSVWSASACGCASIHLQYIYIKNESTIYSIYGHYNLKPLFI